MMIFSVDINRVLSDDVTFVVEHTQYKYVFHGHVAQRYAYSSAVLFIVSLTLTFAFWSEAAS